MLLVLELGWHALGGDINNMKSVEEK